MPIPASSAGAILTVDLAAIVANWRDLAARHGRPTAAVVKADGYGLGAREVARALHDADCRHFFVAHLDEALAIRAVVPDAMLAVLNGLLPNAAADHAGHDIPPVLGSLAEIAAWSAEAARQGRSLNALLHVDTGMARLGLDPAEWAVLLAEPERLAGVAVRFLMTHLVTAEQPDDPLNARQLARFRAAAAAMPGVATSLANSSGLFLGPDFGSDLGRPGAALYGVNPTPGQPNPQRAAATLMVRVLQMRDVGPGDPVGYDATWRAGRPSRIATACVGYADGWPRALSNRGCAYFDGKPVPLVGRVSMDLVTYDATDAPGLVPGDWLELIGPHSPVDEIARQAGTNGYEILTSLGRRYHRDYRRA